MSLGCATAYHAAIHERGGGRKMFDLDRLTAGSWQRRLSDVSQGQVTVAKGQAGAACCAGLAVVEPWLHELSLYRDSALVWQGPVTRTIEDADLFAIEARDMAEWVRRWRAMLPGGPGHLGPDDAVRHIQYLIDQHLAQGGSADPGLAAHIQYVYGASTSELDIAPSTLIGDVLDSLDTAVDYTTVGRRLVVMPQRHTYGGDPVALLSEGHVSGTVEISLEGMEAFTGAVATGSAPEDDPEGTPVWAVRSNAEGMQRSGHRWTTTDVDSTDPDTVAAYAARAARGCYPVPLVLRVQDGASLSPAAPLSVEQLVCGVRVDIAVGQGWCRQAVGATRLAGAGGQWGERTGEQVTVSLVSMGEAGSVPD